MVCSTSFGGPGWRWCSETAGDGGAATQGDPDAERQVVGDYELIDTLGQGGVGVVYRARDLDSDRMVAIKLLTSGARSTPRQRERFQREIAAQMREDPGIVRVLEQGVSPLGPWYAMELIEGPALSTVLEAAGRLPTQEAVRITLAVGECLLRTHRQGLCHRDVKPSNVLMTPGGEPKLSDFGLVLESDRRTRLTATHQAVGTPRYMAPEQLAASVEDWGRVDQYALGVMLYELLGGGLERSGGAERTLPDLPSADRDLMWVLERCTAFDPADRYPTMLELCADLKRWQLGTAVRNRPTALAGRADRWIRSNRASVALAAVTAVLVAMGVAAGVQSKVTHARTERAATAQWQALQQRLESQAWSESAAEFDAFVSSPQAQGSEVLTQAWLWRSLRPDASPSDAIDAAGRAAFARDPAVPDTQSLTRMAALFQEQSTWAPLAGIDALAPDAVSDWQRAHVALAYREFDDAEALLDAPGLFDMLRTRAPLDARQPTTAGAITRVDPTLDAPRWEGETLWVPEGCVVRPAHLVKCEALAWWTADGTLEPVPWPKSATFSAQVGGRRFVSTDDQLDVLQELTPDGWVAAHAQTRALHSYGTGLVAADLDQDGRDELLLTLNQPNGYGIWAYQVPDQGGVELAGFERIGDVTRAVVATTADGPQVMLATTRAIPSVQLFGDDAPYAGPTRLLSVALDDQGLVLAEHLHLQEYKLITDELTALDLDGDGLDELLLTVNLDTESMRATLLMRGTPDGFADPIEIDGLAVVAPLASAPGGPGRAVGGWKRTDGPGMQWVVLGDPGPPPPADPRPDTTGMSAPARLEQLGLLKESARAWLAHADGQQGTEAATARSEAARLWGLADRPADAAQAAMAAGEPASAAEYALAANDWALAAQLDPTWESLATPSFELDLTRPLPDVVQTPLTPAVQQDLAAGTLRLHAVAGAPDILRIPLRATGAPLALHVTLELERMDWSSALRVTLDGPDGPVTELGGPVFHVGAFGSGGQMTRVIKIPCGPLGWPVKGSTDRGMVTLDRGPFHCTARHEQASIATERRQPLHVDPGTQLVLAIGATPLDEGYGVAAATAQLTELRLHGLELDPAREPRALAPWEDWINGGAVPDPAPSANHVAVHLRLAPDHIDAIRDQVGPARMQQAFVLAWGIASGMHLDDPVVQEPIRTAPRLTTQDDWVQGEFLLRQGRTALRLGDPGRAELLALEAQALTRDGEWRTRMGVATLLAELALLHDDPDRALALATQAAGFAPDPALGWRILSHKQRFQDLRDVPGWEALRVGSTPAP